MGGENLIIYDIPAEFGYAEISAESQEPQEWSPDAGGDVTKLAMMVEEFKKELEAIQQQLKNEAIDQSQGDKLKSEAIETIKAKYLNIE